MRKLVMVPCLQYSLMSMLARRFYPAWYWRSHTSIVMVVCSNCRVRGTPTVIGNLSIGIVEQLWYASVIWVMRERQPVALEAVSVAPWTALLQSIHSLYVYSQTGQMSVLIHSVGLKVLYGALYCMYEGMGAPQCRQRCLHSVWPSCGWLFCVD